MRGGMSRILVLILKNWCFISPRTLLPVGSQGFGWELSGEHLHLWSFVCLACGSGECLCPFFFLSIWVEPAANEVLFRFEIPSPLLHASWFWTNFFFPGMIFKVVSQATFCIQPSCTWIQNITWKFILRISNTSKTSGVIYSKNTTSSYIVYKSSSLCDGNVNRKLFWNIVRNLT